MPMHHSQAANRRIDMQSSRDWGVGTIRKSIAAAGKPASRAEKHRGFR
jgi:hypothetical protein